MVGLVSWLIMLDRIYVFILQNATNYHCVIYIYTGANTELKHEKALQEI